MSEIITDTVVENVEEIAIEDITVATESKTFINILIFTSKEGEQIELDYQNVWYIENNGLEVFLDASQYNVNELSALFPSSVFEAQLAVKGVEDSVFSYHNNLMCRSISLKPQENVIQITLPGLTEEAKKYLELQTQIEQLQANLDYVAMEIEVEL